MKRIAVVAAGSLVLGVLLVPSATPAAADADARPGTVAERPRDAGVHAVDGEVRAIAQVGQRVVMGGTFTRVGPVTRGAVGVVDTVGNSFRPGFPDVAGVVAAVAADGSGGWFLGGTFGSVGGLPRTNLAHVDANGAVSDFAPLPDGPVRALLPRPGGGLYVGGDFSTVSGVPAGRLAALDTTGAVSWNGGVSGGAGGVRTLALSADGTRLYLGGDFARVTAVDRRRLAAVDAASGTLDAAFVPGAVNQPVNDLVVHGSSLLVAGDFGTINGTARNRLARLDGVTGALDAINVSINGSVRDIAVDGSNGIVYVAGSFGTVGGVQRPRLAGVNLATGAVTTLQLSNVSGDLSAVALDGAGGLFVAGPVQFTPEKGNPAVLARVSISTGIATALVPYYETPRSLARPALTGTSGPLVLVPSGSDLLVAGDFSDYGVTTRNRLAAYDLATGALVPNFDPAPDADVYTVRASHDGAAVFVGGAFTSLAGVNAPRLAKLDIQSGAPVVGFSASASSYVKDLAVRPDGTALYVGGNFDTFNGTATSRLAAVDPATGQLLPSFSVPLTEPTNDSSEGGLRALSLSTDSTRLMVVGNFRKVAGLDRPLIAQIDVSAPTATVTEWRTELYDQPCARSGKVGFMRDVDISPDGTKAYVVTAGHFYYPACDTTNAFSMIPGAQGAGVEPLWTVRTGDTHESVTASQDTVYISGHFRYLDTETRTNPRFQIAAVDAQTGTALNWVPNAGGFRGVLTLELEPAGLFAGSDGDAFGVVSHGRNAFWPTPSPGIDVRKTPNRSWVIAPNGSVTYTIRVKDTTGQGVTLHTLSDTRLGALSGQGTCVLPQTVPAGGSYTCQVSEVVSGSAATEVPGALTAAARPPTGPDVTDTDTSVVQVLASVPLFRTRIVAGPGQLVFPGGEVRFNVAMMNLDPLRSATLTSLSSPQLGTLTSECGLPRELAPNTMAYCHVDRPVTGSVGSKPSFSFTATAQYDTGILSSSGSTSATINPPIGGTKAVVVVGNPALLSASDKKVQDRLDNNFTLTFVDDTTVQPADVTGDYSFVVLSPSANPVQLGGRLAGLKLPVLMLHSQLLDEMGLTAVGGNGAASGTTVNVVRAMHVLSAARAGTRTINGAAKMIGWGTAAASAEVITSDASGRATEFAHPRGSGMVSGPAPGCRLFFSANDATRFTTDAWALFDRAAAYTSADCGRNLLWTAAGNGSATYGGDGRQSVLAGLSAPWGLAVDNQNRIYVADAGTHSVRRIAVDGTVTTVAGTGTAGYTGDGGQASAARLNAPLRLAFDTAQNLFIADSANNRVRKVTPAGVISTVAGSGLAGSSGDGGPAIAARLRTPTDVTVGPDGSLYIADRANHRIRKVTPGGVISTVAGNGSQGFSADDVAATSSRLSSPHGVALDPVGNLYIADFDNERIRMVTPSGIITTVAGTGIATADGDGGLAVEAGLHKPQYVQVTPAGDLIVSESNNNDVRIVHEGVIDTLAGSRQFGFSGDGSFPLFSTWQRPSATVLDQAGNLWIADRNNRRVRVIQAS